MIEDPLRPREPRLEVVRPIGAGATARVELVRLLESFAGLPAGSELARKILLAGERDRAAARAAFVREAEAAERARDSSLVRVLHLGEHAGLPYLLLQYVPGRTLREVLDQEGPLPEPRLRTLGAELARALGVLHGHGLVHGDVKPENARLDGEGRVVLLDLGFAREARASEGVRGADAGSLAYLSPERALGRPAGSASDVFALGIVLYELATGVHPFGHGRPAHAHRGSSGGDLLRRSIEVRGADELLSAIGAARFVPPSRFVPGLSPLFDRLLSECLARAEDQRPGAQEVRERLEQGEAHPWWRAAIDPTLHTGRGAESPPLGHAFPLVGRERQLAELSGLLGELRAGDEHRSRVAWVVGPEGSGKWRLAQEFAARERLSSEPPLVLDVRWSESDEARPGGALLMLLNRWLQLPPGTAAGKRERERLAELVRPASARVLELALDPRAPRALHHSVPAALGAWLLALSRKHVLLLLVDDVHEAGAITLAALSLVLEALRRARVCTLLVLREDVPAAEPALLQNLRERLRQEGSGSGPVFRRIELAPLDPEAVGELVGRLFHPSAPLHRLTQVLWKKSRGNAGFLTEILRELEHRGALRPEGDADPRWVLDIAPEELPLPRSLDKLLRERFRALEPAERRWLERLCVVGGRIEPGFLVRAFPPTTASEIDVVLARLVRLGWLVAASDRYRFERPALRVALYRSLSPGRRKRLHLSAARGLAQAGRRPDNVEDAFQRAFHLHAAEEHGELLDSVRVSLRLLRRRASAQHLLTLARWGLSALEHQDAERDALRGPARGSERVRLELLEVAADAADRLGRRADQRALLDHLSNLELDLENQTAEGARLYLLHARYASGTGQLGLARGWLRTAAGLAERSGDRWLSSQASRRLAQVQSQVGEFREARALAEQALEQAVGENQLALAHLALAHLDVLEDEIEAALERVVSALSALRRTREARSGVISYAELLRGRIWRSAGLPRRALGALQRSLKMARRAGERRLEAEARARRGGVLLELARPAQGRIELQEARLVSEEIEDPRGQVLSRLVLASLEESEEAELSLERAVALAREIGFQRATALGLALLGRRQHARGELALASRAAEEGEALLARHGAELADRIVIVGTRALLMRAEEREGQAELLIGELEQRMRACYARIAEVELRSAQRAYAERLLAAALSDTGAVFPLRT